MKRRFLGLLAFAIFSSMGAQQRTPNFVVHAPNQAIADQVAEYAERYRREKAVEWLGREMPAWRQPCPISVNVSMDPPSGATSFSFGGGGVQWMKMEIRGPLDRLLASVLPHEVTHTVFAHHFGCPVPRWADEGGSVLSEDELERQRHDQLVRDILNKGGQIPLRRLLALKEYPPQVMCLYAQGFSLCDFLVKRSNRPTFLNFVGHGMDQGWDRAVNVYYGHRNVEELEEAWLKHLRESRRDPSRPAVDLAKGTAKPPASPAAPEATPTGRNLVRFTVPPSQPLAPPPIVRGAMPGPGEMGERFGMAAPPTAPPAAPPPAPPAFPRASNPGWTPVLPTPTVTPVPREVSAPVRLGLPVAP